MLEISDGVKSENNNNNKNKATKYIVDDHIRQKVQYIKCRVSKTFLRQHCITAYLSHRFTGQENNTSSDGIHVKGMINFFEF